MHLDTVCTMVDVDKVVMYPNVAHHLQAWAVTLVGGADAPDDTDLELHVAEAEPFLVAAAKAMQIDTLHQIDTGLSTRSPPSASSGTTATTPSPSPAGRRRLRAQRRDQRPPRGVRHRGREDRRLRARLAVAAGRAACPARSRARRWRPDASRRDFETPGAARRFAPLDPEAPQSPRPHDSPRFAPDCRASENGKARSLLTGRQQRPGRIKTYGMVDGSTTVANGLAKVSRRSVRTVRLADRDLPIGQPVAGRTLLGGQRRAVRQCLVEGRAERRRGSSSASAPVLEPLEVPDRHQEAVGAEHPDQARARRELVASGHVQPGEGVERVRLRLGSHPAQVLLVVTSVQYAASTELSRELGDAEALACSRAACRSAEWSSTSATHHAKPSCTVTSRSSPETSAPAGAARGPGVGQPDDTGLGLERLEQHGPEVARRVAEVVLHLEPEPDDSRVAHHRGRRGGEHRAEQHLAVGVRSPSASGCAVADGTSSRRATTSRSPGMPSTAGRRRPRPRRRPPVAVLPAAASRPARAGRRGPTAPSAGAAFDGVRDLLRERFAMRRNLPGGRWRPTGAGVWSVRGAGRALTDHSTAVVSCRRPRRTVEVEHHAGAVGDHGFAGVARQTSRSSAVLTVHTWMSRPVSASRRRRRLANSRSRSTPGPRSVWR